MKSHFLFLGTISLLLFFFTSCKDQEITPKNETKDKTTVSVFPASLNIPVQYIISWRLTVIVKVNDIQQDSFKVAWSSNNSRIAIVDGTGLVTAIGAGSTSIIGIVNGKDSVKCEVNVTDENDYKYRVILKNKGTSGYSINRPEEFLSSKAIARRNKWNIPVNETDLPISSEYIEQIENTGAIVIVKSKWLQTVTVNSSDIYIEDRLKNLPFVKDVVKVGQAIRNTQKARKDMAENNLNRNAKFNKSDIDSTYYGSAWNNINVNNGQILHDQGFKGSGIDIAVIDEGFLDITTNTSLNNIKIKGAKSFIYEDKNPYVESHGIWVTSCMATNKPGYFVGTAPDANYWLLRTEVATSEYPVEEDYWVAAIEFADSAGVDLVNSSLSYSFHDGPNFNYKWEDMDGKTAMATQGANMAFNKGIFIVNCAGNTSGWVGAPADSPNVLTVGAINKSGVIGDFSSFGMTVDGRIKPDVVALGVYPTAVISIDNWSEFRFGTSYSSPIICGLVACLWQAYPKLTNKQLLDIIRKSSDRYNNPEIPYGYGIPNMQKAMQLAQQL